MSALGWVCRCHGRSLAHSNPAPGHGHLSSMRGTKAPLGQRLESEPAHGPAMTDNPTRARGGASPLEVPSFFGPTLHPAVARLIGGRRGMVDGALSPALFVATNALGGVILTRPQAITAAVAVAGTAALTLGVLRWSQDRTLQQVIRGLMALTVAAVFVVLSGEARAFFLPGIYVDAIYALAFAGSVLVGRPLVGLVYAALFGTGPVWRENAAGRRIFAVASLGWSGVYAARAGAQWALYQQDQPLLMAVAKIALGWPLTVVAVALTLAALRRTLRSTTPAN
jgi:hypothetical protein